MTEPTPQYTVIPAPRKQLPRKAAQHSKPRPAPQNRATLSPRVIAFLRLLVEISQKAAAE